jgi:transcriptional regulator with XRE-family HTH domain
MNTAQLRLRELRQARGYTLQGLAKATGLHFVTIWRLEQRKVRKPDDATLTKLSEALGVSRPLLAWPPQVGQK